MAKKTVIETQRTFYLPGVRPFLQTFGEYVAAGRIYGDAYYYDARKRGRARFVGKGYSTLTVRDLVNESYGTMGRRGFDDGLRSLEEKGIIYRDRDSRRIYATLPEFVLQRSLGAACIADGEITRIADVMRERRGAFLPGPHQGSAAPLMTLYLGEMRVFLCTLGEYVVAGRIYGDAYYVNNRGRGAGQFVGCGYSSLTAADLVREGQGTICRSTVDTALGTLEASGIIYRDRDSRRIYAAAPSRVLRRSLEKGDLEKDEIERIVKETADRRKQYLSDFCE